MLKILCVCGCGLGSSFAIEMTAKAVLKKLEIPAHIQHHDTFNFFFAGIGS